MEVLRLLIVMAVLGRVPSAAADRAVLETSLSPPPPYAGGLFSNPSPPPPGASYEAALRRDICPRLSKHYWCCTAYRLS